MVFRVEMVMQETFQECHCVRDVISLPILSEEEGVYACGCGVVARGGVVFEEVEEGEGGEEVGEAPVGGVGGCGEVEG